MEVSSLVPPLSDRTTEPRVQNCVLGFPRGMRLRLPTVETRLLMQLPPYQHIWGTLPKLNHLHLNLYLRALWESQNQKNSGAFCPVLFAWGGLSSWDLQYCSLRSQYRQHQAGSFANGDETLTGRKRYSRGGNRDLSPYLSFCYVLRNVLDSTHSVSPLATAAPFSFSKCKSFLSLKLRTTSSHFKRKKIQESFKEDCGLTWHSNIQNLKNKSQWSNTWYACCC